MNPIKQGERTTKKASSESHIPTITNPPTMLENIISRLSLSIRAFNSLLPNTVASAALYLHLFFFFFFFYCVRRELRLTVFRMANDYSVNIHANSNFSDHNWPKVEAA